MQYTIGIVLLLAVSCYSYGQSELRARDPMCQSRNAYYEVHGSCDAYTECLEYTAIHRQCLDGMYFNRDAIWPEYPCGYPSDVSCGERSMLQPAAPTGSCPHQYGLFPSPLLTAVECQHYYMCVAGKPFERKCAEALAFNPESGRCDWPDLVPSCNADEYLHFKCPPGPVDEHNNPIDVVVNYRFEKDCFRFFSCHLGVARLLSCDLGFAFNSITGRCENSEYTNCSA